MGSLCLGGLPGGDNMRMPKVVIAAVVAVCCATVAQALERDAKVVGKAEVDVVSYKNMNAARVVVWDETALNLEREWAVVAGAGVGRFFSSAEGGDVTMYFGALGAKWYPRTTTSIQLLGSCEWAGSGSGFRVISGMATVEQRFITEQSALSPYVAFSAALQNAQVNPWGSDEKPFSCMALKAAVGCDLIVSSDVTIEFQVLFTDSQDRDHNVNRDYADGWTGTVGLKYFWF